MSEIKILDVEVSFPDILDVDVDFGQTLTKIVAPEHYTGPFDIFPSDEDQIIPVKEKMPVEDICVKGITGEETITQNGTYNVLTDKTVAVNVPNFLSGVLDKSISGDLYLDTEFDQLFPQMFRNCNNLRSINLPNFRGAVTADMITDASNLEEFLVPNATSVTRASFTGTPKLTKIDIRNVTSIGQFCFRGAGMLEYPVILLKPVEFSHTDYVAISAKEIRMCKEPTFIRAGTFSRPVYNWYFGFSEERAAELGFPWGASQMKSVHYNVIFDEEGNIIDEGDGPSQS